MLKNKGNRTCHRLKPSECRLIVALDMPDAGEALAFWQRLETPGAVAKIGLELLFAGGVELARRLTAGGTRVFVDAKLFDIGNTVERATARVAALGATFLTVHAQDPQTLAAAVRGRASSGLKLLGITLLYKRCAGQPRRAGHLVARSRTGAAARTVCRRCGLRWRGLLALGS